ncbi:R3H and coiled-coil domain-containing protein 1-like isoform X3 [Brienomyrus brachyistius]|nr:R3H and coiled-coil domain-containing protein 1-like isoform X3 [Brienomyrus brachyistius]XP_048846781.1 R3H and coiled-coil domain-containing protein 1-like isoform X3 [Brienomyrus brachyistius]XP_048846790.1 R3H and coiled-coil domain-containing protein 1-like isoform X3 [Brienomyrus brachyistius]XP_048846799.1 R3H and coiled-coil domain-containing protein 1-like isoform X3 [Brienomyrus brachyistius]
MASNFMEMNLDDCPGGGSIAPVLVLTRPQMKDADDSEAYTKEILAYLDDMDFAIEKAKNDYSYYGRVCIDLQEFSHVLEIYGYPPMFNTDDLLDAFVDFREEGLTIKRVDNTHALGIFSSESAALRALSIRHPLLKIRKLSKGINKSRAKAVSCAEFIQSMREGPRKDTAGPEGQSC